MSTMNLNNKNKNVLTVASTSTATTTMTTTTAPKKTQGRRRIEIKKIVNQNNRHVTFSKRRLGLFKKASELCILSGAEIAIIVQSFKRQRVFAFGHPSPDSVINRYLTGKSFAETSGSGSGTDQSMQSYFNVQQHNQYYTQICRELEAEKKKEEMIRETKMLNIIDTNNNNNNNNSNSNNGVFWWDEPVDNMGLEELEEFMTSLEELKKKVTMRADELTMIRGSSSLPSSSVNSSTMVTNNGRSGLDIQDHNFLNQSVDYCSSIVPFSFESFDHSGQGQF